MTNEWRERGRLQPATLLLETAIRSGNTVLTSEDAGRVVPIEAVGEGVTLTIPSQEMADIPIGTVVTIHNVGTSPVQVIAAFGVTLREADFIYPRQQAILRKRMVNEWVQNADSNNAKTDKPQSFTALQFFEAGLAVGGRYTQSLVSADSQGIDCSSGNYFSMLISTNTTLSFVNVPVQCVYAFTLEVLHSGGSITWPAGVGWPSSTPPMLALGKTHLFTLITKDGGLSWRAAAQTNFAN